MKSKRGRKKEKEKKQIRNPRKPKRQPKEDRTHTTSCTHSHSRRASRRCHALAHPVSERGKRRLWVDATLAKTLTTCVPVPVTLVRTRRALRGALVQHTHCRLHHTRSLRGRRVRTAALPVVNIVLVEAVLSLPALVQVVCAFAGSSCVGRRRGWWLVLRGGREEGRGCPWQWQWQ